jgi:hypothetical protein
VLQTAGDAITVRLENNQETESNEVSWRVRKGYDRPPPRGTLLALALDLLPTAGRSRAKVLDT